MTAVTVTAGTRLKVTYELHLASDPIDQGLIAIHHGICHTRGPFQELIKALHARGLHVVTIEQKSGNAGFGKNFIGLSSYRTGLMKALKQIESDAPQHKILAYVCHSMGALITEETQKKYPELQRPTIFMTPIPVNGALPITLRILFRRPWDYFKAVFTLSVHSLVDTDEEVKLWFFDPDTPDEFVQQTTPQLTHSPFWSYLQLVLRPLIRPWIKDDGQPKLLMINGTDEIFKLREYRNIRRRYPNIDEVHFPGGHDFFIEYASETAQEVALFLAALPPPPEPIAARAPAPVPRPKFLDARSAPKKIPAHKKKQSD